MVKLIAEGVSFEVDEKLESVTTYFRDIADIEGKKDDIVLTIFSKDQVQKLFEILKIANYSFKQVNKVNQSNPEAFIGENLTKYFDSMILKNWDSINGVYKLAKFLKIEGLQKTIAAYLAAKVYIKLNLDEYNKKKKQLGITQELTPARSKQLKQKFAFLN